MNGLEIERHQAFGAQSSNRKASAQTRTQRIWDGWMQFLANYHECEVIDAHHVPSTGGGVFVGTHSLATYELFIAIYATRVLRHRRCSMVCDRLFFKIPGIQNALREIGFVEGSRAELIRRLQAGEMLGIAPGGMAESLRSSSQRFQFDWSRRIGFAAIAARAGVPVVPHACPQADYIYEVYGNVATDWVYKKFRLPFPIFRGRSVTLVPRPVKLIHFVGEPIMPDVPPDRVQDEDIKRFHGRVVEAMERLIARGRTMGDRPVGSDVRSLIRRTPALEGRR
jgi:1-acyl-sn-glycerol-3-phosphate acyltransferase